MSHRIVSPSLAARRPLRCAKGFILVATLWIMAGLALLAAYVDNAVTEDIERAIKAREAIQKEIDLLDTENTLIYMLVTGRMGHRGLLIEPVQRFYGESVDGASLPLSGDGIDGVLQLAGQTYQGIGETLFSVQDESGLVSISTPGTRLFPRVLASIGLSESEISRLVPKIEDYVDHDREMRMGGAEDYEYRLEKMPVPANWMMTSPLELQQVLGSDVLTPDQWQRLLPMLSMHQLMGYNFNTMRLDVIAAWLNVDEESLQALEEARSWQSINDPQQIASLTGETPDIDKMEYLRFPQRYLRIAIWSKGDRTQRFFGIRLRPLGDKVPWNTVYRYPQPLVPDEAYETPRLVPTSLFQEASPDEEDANEDDPPEDPEQ
ncbi:general secretion pathway protein GspK [Thioalkalivibrio sp. HK1]|uniref:general secretion pathway protein GspK n=1 Tax=Thioalkalivibrio sp. HK1 TaxID=1469245 RepID=UPI0004B87623|nr:type II secretion system protein GspK [Thioalkalivibrio sp. HK1]